MLRVVVVACALAAFACKKKDGHDEAKKVTTSSTDDATTDLVDPDYRFRLRWPGEGWKVMREADARHLNSDAVAGLSNGKINAIVIVEHAPGAELQGFADLLVENMQYENKEAKKSDAKLADLPAVRLDLSGTINGMAVKLRGLVVLHQEYAYQMMAFVPAGMGNDADLDRAIAAFSLEPGVVKGRGMSTAVEDQIGVGWRIAAGVFESAATRLRVRPRDGWRLLIGDELRKSNMDAEVGLINAKSGVYVTIIPEPVTPADRDTYVAGRFTSLLQELTPLDEPVRAKLLGTDVELRRARSARGLPLEYLLGVLVTQGRGYQFVSWYPPTKRAQIEPDLLAMLSSIELLSGADASKVASELGREKDHQNVVAATYAVRGGTYYDFENKVRWRKPAGFWRIDAGQEARAGNADASLKVEEVTRGIHAQLIVEPAEAFDGRSYHAAIEDGLIERGLTVIRRGSAQLAGTPARLTEGSLDGGGMTLRHRVTTAVVGSLALQFSVWSTVGAWPVEATITEIVAGVEVDPQMREIVAGPEFRDHRLGYAMRLPSAWKRDPDVTPQTMRPIASLSSWSSGGSTVMALAFYTFEQRDDRWFLDLVEQMLRQHFGAKGIGKADTSEVTLAGRAARRLSWGGLVIGRVDAVLVKRDSTFYAVMSIDKLGTTRTYELARDAFSLLD